LSEFLFIYIFHSTSRPLWTNSILVGHQCDGWHYCLVIARRSCRHGGGWPAAEQSDERFTVPRHFEALSVVYRRCPLVYFARSWSPSASLLLFFSIMSFDSDRGSCITITSVWNMDCRTFVFVRGVERCWKSNQVCPVLSPVTLSTLYFIILAFCLDNVTCNYIFLVLAKTI